MKRIFPTILIAFAFFGCSNESDPVADKATFSKVYDNDGFNTSYYPIDITQTSDGGYLILGGRRLEDSNFSGAYVLRVDEFGGYVSDQEVDEAIIDPIGPLLSNNGNYSFFSMTSIGLQSQLITIDPTGAIISVARVGGTYPAAAAADGDNYLLLSYDNDKKQSVVSVVAHNGDVSASKGYTIGEGDAVEAPIINHFIRSGRQYPFQVGKTLSGKYFFNGFYNYTFSLVFTNLTEEKPNAVQGQQDDGGLNQVVPLSGDVYATSRFNFGDNYFLPAATLRSDALSSSSDLAGNSFPELIPDAPVKILSMTLGGKDIIVYASNTRSRQIGLYAYDKSTGKFLGSKYVGFTNPFEFGAMTVTSDGGLAVCGTTYVAGRFPRICLFKYSAADLTASF